MDDIATTSPSRGLVPADGQRIAALTRENRRQQGALATLHALLQMNARSVSNVELQKLREANEHLVLAAFGAQDSFRHGGGARPSATRQDMQPHVFDLLTQGEQTLVRTIAQIHGGAVTVASDGPGCGCEFRVALPLPAPALSHPAPMALSACAMPP